MKAFLVINKEEYDMAGHFLTGLPIGDYCDIISGIYVNNACSGPGNCVNVDANGYAVLNIRQGSNSVVALHVDVPCCAPGACSSNLPPPPSK
ncbi:unnamed protein product [Clavelina lepadiformis]|uniref:Alpha-amylase C-terminal domain-containing protein n=1 Tax=Clavelina lepadiformis TaxID=159417 RepID=A0ABP0GE73_CLALP